MNNHARKLMPVVVAATLFPLHGHAADMKWNGFLDMTYMLSDGTATGTSTTQSKFDINGELDMNAALANKLSTRIDLDVGKADNTKFGVADGDSGRFEQAFIAWESLQGVRVKGGVFNNPLGWEAEDAPDMYQITHGQLYDIWNATTDLYGNNVLGVGVSGSVGPVTLTGAFLNDLMQVDEQNSFMGVVNFKPNEQLDIEAGFVTQDIGLETILDFNATYTAGLFMVGGEIMLPSQNIDMGIAVTGMYKLTDQISGALRFDDVSYDTSNVDDSTSITFAMSYAVDKNLTANLEVRMNSSDNSVVSIVPDGDMVQLEAIATF